MSQVINSLKSRKMQLPIYGGTADLAVGAIVMPGVTAETDLGVLINSTAASMVDAIGVLTELHDYSESGDALVTGAASWWIPTGTNKQIPARDVELIDTATLIAIQYDTDDTMAVASYSAPTVTITSLEDNIDTSWLYIVSGTGIGQTGFIDTSTSGSCTVDDNFTTALDATSTAIKILRLFHQLVKIDVATATDFTKLGTDAAAGTARLAILGSHIVRNGLDERLDPIAHSNLQSLNSLSQLKFYAVGHIQNTFFHPVD